jgi:hypothetical protein
MLFAISVCRQRRDLFASARYPYDGIQSRGLEQDYGRKAGPKTPIPRPNPRWGSRSIADLESRTEEMDDVLHQ